MVNEKLEKLKHQKQVLEARIKQEEGREKAKARKADTRRKILAGAWLLDEMEQRKDFKEFVLKKLDSFLSRPDDRALFELPALEQNTVSQTKKTKAVVPHKPESGETKE